MLKALESTDVAKLPLAPKNPLPYRHQLRAVRSLIDGHQELLDAGGPVTRIVLGPKWLFPTAVLIASPQGARDVLGRTDEIADRGETPTVIDGWRDGATVDLDTECRALTMRALGRSVLGLDLDAKADAVGPALRTALSWVADRATRPVNLPQWVPTPGQQRAQRANATLHQLAAEILAAVRADPDRDAPLVRALITAADPQTGQPLSDDEISATSWCCSSSPATTPHPPL